MCFEDHSYRTSAVMFFFLSLFYQRDLKSLTRRKTAKRLKGFLTVRSGKMFLLGLSAVLAETTILTVPPVVLTLALLTKAFLNLSATWKQPNTGKGLRRKDVVQEHRSLSRCLAVMKLSSLFTITVTLDLLKVSRDIDILRTVSWDHSTPKISYLPAKTLLTVYTFMEGYL